MRNIWEGRDHILFLMALLLPAVLIRSEEGGWEAVETLKSALWQTLKVLTVFTLAHSLTLYPAALGWMSLPSRWVETAIAVSIGVTALDILVPVFKRGFLVVVFLFGLLHGFGFAAILGQMELQGWEMVSSLFGFNIGVELGQAAIVIAVFPLLYVARSLDLYRRGLIQLGAVIIILVSAYWSVERGLDIDIPLGRWLFG